MKEKDYETCDLMHGNICVSTPCFCKRFKKPKKIAMKMIAKFEKSEQVTDSEWDVIEYFLEVTPETTIQQIINWRDKITQRPLLPAYQQIPFMIHAVDEIEKTKN